MIKKQNNVKKTVQFIPPFIEDNTAFAEFFNQLETFITETGDTSIGEFDYTKTTNYIRKKLTDSTALPPIPKSHQNQNFLDKTLKFF